MTLAWVVERTTLPARGTWTALLAAPLVVPAFVTSFGWVSLLPSVASPGGALLVVTLAYYPLVFLPVAATLRGLDPALEETAEALGLSGAAAFARVVLPQLRPALLGGSLLVGRLVTRELVLRVLKVVGVRLSAQQAAKYVPLAGQAVSAVLTFSALKYVCEQHILQCMEVSRLLMLPAPEPADSAR